MTDPTSLPNFPPPPDEHPLRGRVLDALIDLELQPDIDKDGDVAFSANEQQLYVRCTEGDLQIMRVFGQWQMPEELRGDELRAHQVCNQLNLTLNCVKTGVANDTVVVTAEHVAGPGTDVRMLVQISVQVVLSAVHHWHQIALGLTGETDGADGADDDSEGSPS